MRKRRQHFEQGAPLLLLPFPQRDMHAQHNPVATRHMREIVADKSEPPRTFSAFRSASLQDYGRHARTEQVGEVAMQSLWEKLDWKEKAWLGAVYGVSLALIFLIGYNLGRVRPHPQPLSQRERGVSPHPQPLSQRERGATVAPDFAPALREREEEANAPVQEIDLSGSETPSAITVHVAGQVNKPGVYTLPSGSRLRDAIQQAGGTKADADLDGVNLAEPLSDGQKVYVPSKAETRVATASAEPRAPASRDAPRTPPRFPLDINRATAEELERLPGIGPVLAARIVEYRRQHGQFQSVEELLEVRGIGPKRLEQIRPYVVVR